MHRKLLSLAAVAATGLLCAAPLAHAGHEQQITPDISKLPYQPEGHFKAGDPLPDADAFETVEPHMEGKRFNPSGVYNAFDTNVFEVLALPYRAAGDEHADDPYGNGSTDGETEPRHGHCGGDERSDRERGGDYAEIAGECPNHQLEYVDYYEETMRHVLGDFGVVMHRYEFANKGSSNTQAGRAINPAAVVPGAEHPDHTVIIGAHYDQTNDGPASAWDSQEGHAQIIRVAKLMADYWKSTGTRPSATVKFIPWDAEESGTLGSAHYADNNVPPGEAAKVRGYWNTDPCAGGYPAFRYGNPADRVDLGIQLANIRPSDDPAALDDTKPPASAEPRFSAFNAKARQIVEDVFDQLDDTLTVAGNEVEIFVSTSEGGALSDIAPEGGPNAGHDVVIDTARPIAFSSDWRNFERHGIPFFNPGPEITGPSSQLDPGNPDALVILHSPLDNLQTLNAYTGAQQDGREMSEGWMKGMEMCAHLLSWGMLQPEQAGAVKTSGAPVAYFEALPNEVAAGRPTTFDASGSHQLVGGQAQHSHLEYHWEFGDGETATGRVVRHTYLDRGRHETRLTVRDPSSGATDTMTVPITVVFGLPDPPGPALEAPSEDGDGTFPLTWSFNGGTVETYLVEEGTALETLLTEEAEALAGWSPQEPVGEGLSKWELSDGSTPKVRGNLKHGGQRSFWGGVAAQDQRAWVGPDSGETSLVLDEPLALPADKPAALTYWSDFIGDINDRGVLEAAVDRGDGSPLDWSAVDSVGGEGYTQSIQTTGRKPAQFERRVADLSAFAGETVRLRFTYRLGTTYYLNVHRSGWYVDDMSLVAADFSTIGETAETSFDVTGRTDGSYLYRVRALLAGDVATRPSNPATVTVTGNPAPAPSGESAESSTGSPAGSSTSTPTPPAAGAPAKGGATAQGGGAVSGSGSGPASTTTKPAKAKPRKAKKRRGASKKRRLTAKQRRALAKCKRSAARKTRSKARRKAAYQRCERKVRAQSRGRKRSSAKKRSAKGKRPQARARAPKRRG